MASGLQALLEHQVESAKATAVKTAAPTVSFLFSQDWDSGSLPSPGCAWGCLAPGVPLGASSFGQRAQGQRLMGWCQKGAMSQGATSHGVWGCPRRGSRVCGQVRNCISVEQPHDQQQGVGAASWLGKRPAGSPWEKAVQADTGQVQPCGPNSSGFWAHTGSGEKLCRLGGSPWEGGSQRLLGRAPQK